MNSIGRIGMRVAVMGLALGAASVSSAQRGGNSGTTPAVPSVTGDTNSPTLGPGGADDAMRNRTARMEVEMEKSRNSERQKKLVADTEKLLSLANELKADVDKSTKDTLSLDVIRKADEIEKLARSVRERMKAS